MSKCAGFIPLTNGGDYVGEYCCRCGERESAHRQKIKVINPWFRKDSAYSREFYECDPISLKGEHRSVSVYERFHGAYLYVLGDCAITERSGFKKNEFQNVIDEILDGLTPSNDGVVSHLRNLGHKGLTYDEYMVEYRAGRMP